MYKLENIYMKILKIITAFLLFVVMAPVFISSQELTFPQRSSLPWWIGSVLSQLDPPNRYEFSSRLNPFYLQGDFDGDNKQDIAIWIKNRETNKSGIAIIHRSTGNIYLVGAGNPIVNEAGEVLWAKSKGGDSLDFIDAWLVYEKDGVGQGVGEGPPPILKGDALLLINRECQWNSLLDREKLRLVPAGRLELNR